MHRFRKLTVWQKGMDVVLAVYKAARHLPVEERYGLRMQMCRCAVSIPSNIAEGSGRNSDKEFLHFLGIAMASSYELETQIIWRKTWGSSKKPNHKTSKKRLTSSKK